MSSVSRVLSGHPDVSRAMQERVLAAVAELAYEPDLLAQSLRRQETMTIGFAVGDISNPLFAEIAAAAETRLRAAGYSMLLTNSEARAELDAAHIALLAQRRVDGIILSVSDEKNPATRGARAARHAGGGARPTSTSRTPSTSTRITRHAAGRRAPARSRAPEHRDDQRAADETGQGAARRSRPVTRSGPPKTYRSSTGCSRSSTARAAGELLSLEDRRTALDLERYDLRQVALRHRTDHARRLIRRL
jgi:hypothetical protein